MVVRRSTTRWTWPSDFNRAARSRVTFMGRLSWRVQSVHPGASLIGLPAGGADFGAAASEIARRAADDCTPRINGQTGASEAGCRGRRLVIGRRNFYRLLAAAIKDRARPRAGRRSRRLSEATAHAWQSVRMAERRDDAAAREQSSPASAAPRRKVARAGRRGARRSRPCSTGLHALHLGVDRRAAGVIVFYAPKLPPIDQLAVPKRPPNIAILADDGTLLANRGDTGGAAIRLADLPPYLPKAFIAIEDRRFYSHWGVDPLGILRALTRNAVRRRDAGRLDADPAARQESVPDAGAHHVAQDPGSDPRALARA